MSREFGTDNVNGYLHVQVDVAASDLAEGSQATTRAWATLIRESYPVAYAICSAEAADSTEAASIIASIEALPRLRRALDEVDAYLRPFRAVADQAVRDALRKTP